MVEACFNGGYGTYGVFEMWAPRGMTDPKLLREYRRELIKHWMRVVVDAATDVPKLSRWTEASKPVRKAGLLFATSGLG